MKNHRSKIESMVKQGQEFIVLNHGKPAARIISTEPRKVLVWPDHLKTALRVPGKNASDVIIDERNSGW